MLRARYVEITHTIRARYAYSASAAKGHAKAQEGGKWKWSYPPGNGVCTAYMTCNAHVDCNRQFRIGKEDSEFYISHTGVHSAVVQERARKNSLLTCADDALLRNGLDLGAVPGKVRSTRS